MLTESRRDFVNTLGTLILAAAVPVCDVPVFRYALVHWPADAYEAVIYLRGPLEGGDAAVVGALERQAGRSLNLRIRRADPAAEAGLTLPALPWMVLRYPGAEKGILWEGKPSDLSASALVDSPARRELAKRILEGGAAVWVLLESGDRTKDDAAASLLGACLRAMEEKIKLPGASPDAAAPPLRLAFSVLRLSRDDPSEGMFVRMLLRSEEGLETLREPMVFPVFGRGRKLEALVGKGISEENIGEYGAFLSGPCSCRVKLQNPGVDLLIAAEWESMPGGEAAGVPSSTPFPLEAPPPRRSLPLAWGVFGLAAAGTALAGAFVLRRP